MSNIKYMYSPNQEEPYQLYKRKIKFKKTLTRVKKYTEILSKYTQNVNEIIPLIKDLKEHGCTYAFVTNVIIDEFIRLNGKYDDEKFKQTFGISLKVDDETIDYNIFMLDLFATLYKIVKMDIYKYDVHIFDDEIKAAENLLNQKYDNTTDALIGILNAGYIPDGITLEGKLKYKNTMPQKTTIIGTYEEIAYQLFKIKNQDITMEELQIIAKKNEMELIEEYRKPESKFSGLTNHAINMWVNYYFKKNNINLYFNSININNNFKTIEELKKQLEIMTNNNYVIGISSNPGSEIKIYDPVLKSYEHVSTKQAGHQMTFRCFNEQDNIVVESWGKEYIIDKKHYKELSLQATQIMQTIDVQKNESKSK